MRCFVISLRRSVERRRRLRAQLDAAGVDYSFFEAVEFGRDRNRYFHHCDDAQFLLNTGRAPTAAELGCFASHLMLWRSCRLLDEPLVVLEDDALLRDDFADSLRFVARHVHRLGFVRLQVNGKSNQIPVVEEGQRNIVCCARYPHGSMAYAISPGTADRFIRACEVCEAPVDVFIKRFWRHGQALYALRPAAVDQRPACRQSTTGRRPADSLPPALSFKRWWHKRKDAVQRAKFNAARRRQFAARRPWRKLPVVLKDAFASVFQNR